MAWPRVGRYRRILLPQSVPIRAVQARAAVAPGYFDYPKICLTGLWLEDAGFLLGQPYEIEVSRGKLVLRTV